MCHLHSLSEVDAAITAQRRQSPSENTGFTFLGCKITGVKSTVLGRPWSTVFYREYKCYAPGANAGKRVELSGKLRDNEAKLLLTKNMIGGKSWIRSTSTRFKRASAKHA
ncbi:putative DNA polymerase epsilon catalytic subunit A [Hibiscus syriacus]|uniref:DNA polymerase epsilon catalytic subunit A n=1 Tax=Hibiscus syriacus TaxID=106335 RepID=A0A6A2ZXJ4_HIBSY|nr:putative DNA polymerase epsilon catalytic subunit A [Hibiscus syriacus]